MRSSVLVASLLASLALAKPLVHVHKRRAIFTDVVVVTVTVTNSADASAATDGWGGWGDWGFWGGRHGGSSAPANAPAAATTVVTTTESPAFFTFNSAPPTQAPPDTTEAATPTASATQPPASTGSVSDYAQAILDQHNNHRQNHTVPALVWSDDMASIAQQIAASCVYAHNTQAGGGGYGQNIGAGVMPAGVPALITNLMYDDEIENFPLPYGQANPSMDDFENWGHFSQIVWKATTAVGCATQYCPGGLANTGGGIEPYFTVCNYSPPGNVGGEYGDNVLAPQGEPSVFIS